MLIGVYLLVFLTGDKHASPKLGIDGSNLVITVPGNDSSEARNLGQTARLYIRPVIHVSPAQGQGQQPPTAGPPGAPPGAPEGAPPPAAPAEPGGGPPPIAPAEP